MNSPPGGTPDKAPLRVYLSGDVDPAWRLSLLETASRDKYSSLTLESGDEVMKGALPYGHDLVGPYRVNRFLNPPQLVPKDIYERERLQHLLNAERIRMRQISKTDIVFAWMGVGSAEIGVDLGIEIGLAYGVGKAVVLAAPSDQHLHYLPVATELAWKIVVAQDALTAYKRVMADLDVTFDRGMARIESKYGGPCMVCHGSYKPGDMIYWSKPRGGMHIDCHDLVFSKEELSNVVFNSELVRALRVENAELEKQLLDLTTEKSMLEQQLATEKKANEELYAEYEKWVHP